MKTTKQARLLAFLLLSAAAPAAAADFSVDTLNVSYSIAQEAYTLTWDTIEASTTNANVTYRIYFASGAIVTSSTHTHMDTTSGNTYLFKPALIGREPYGTYSFRVFADDSVSGFVDSSPVAVYYFFNNLVRGDENGSQVGHGLVWNFDTDLQADANITATIHPPGATATYDVNNFVSAMSSAAVKTIMSGIPYSAAINSYKLSFDWDSRSSTGSIVPNGIYWLWLKASDQSGSVRYSDILSVPVDILRFTNLSTTGITISEDEATINYTINGDMLVTILICTPGTEFTNAGSAGSVTYLSGLLTYSYQEHDPLPMDPGTGTVNGNRILRVLRFYRQSGSHTETWPGTDAAGQGQSRGIYAVAVSGRDDFGNRAVKGSGDDGPLSDTIVLDQTAPSSGSGGGGSTPDFFSPTVSSLTPASGATVTSILASVSAIMTDNTGGSGVNGTNSSLRVRNSSGTLLSGTTSFSNGTYRFTFTDPLTRANNGIYTITATAVDNAGNVSVPSTGTFTLNIEDPNVFAAGVPVFAYPNPAKGVSSVDISFNTNRAATMKLEIFNMLGELVYERNFTSVPGAQTVNWDLRNGGGEAISTGFYLYRLSGEDSSAEQEIIKKLVVVQ